MFLKQYKKTHNRMAMNYEWIRCNSLPSKRVLGCLLRRYFNSRYGLKISENTPSPLYIFFVEPWCLQSSEQVDVNLWHYKSLCGNCLGDEKRWLDPSTTSRYGPTTASTFRWRWRNSTSYAKSTWRLEMVWQKLKKIWINKKLYCRCVCLSV